MRFVDRVGLALVAPRRAFAAAEEEKSGLNDATVLLLCKFVCLELKALVAVAWTALVAGAGAALGGLSGRFVAAVGTDLVLLLGAGLVVTVLAGSKRAAGKDFDLAAVAWVPALVVELAGALLGAFVTLRPWARTAITAAALAWMGAWVVLAVIHARRRGA